MDQRTVNDLADELGLALRELQVPAEVTPAGVRPDGLGELVVDVDGRTLGVAVTTRAELRPAAARELPVFVPGRTEPAPALRAARRGRAPGPAPIDAEAGLVFTDRSSGPTRDVLRDHGWGWLDRRRGELRLWVRGLRIDARVTPTVRPEDRSRARDPFTPAGRQLALWLLLHPTVPASPRAISREIGISAGQVSTLLRALADDSLLRRDRTPLVPELFWALAEHWAPRRHPLASLPGRDALAASSELRAGQWVLGDTRAAAAYGAPVAIGPGHPPDLYVPDQRTLSWVLNRTTPAPDPTQRAATVAVAPVPLVTDTRFRRTEPGEDWPLAPPVVVALDLAVDRGRGREVLEQWQPDDEDDRVW